MNYESQGKIKLLGCTTFKFVENFIASHSVGSRVFIKSKAAMGKIEFVFIKKIKRLFPKNASSKGTLAQIMYEDTLNRIWSEEELITESQAKNLYQNYSKEIRDLREKVCTPLSKHAVLSPLSIPPSTAVTIIAVSYGGTGLTSYEIGDLIYASGPATLSRLASGPGKILRMNSAGTAPEWSNTIDGGSP